MTGKILSLTFLALSLSACAPAYVLWDKDEFPPSNIKAGISSIVIVDTRKNTRKIEFKKRDWFGKFSFEKELSKKDKDLIYQEVARNFVPGEANVKITVQISEANVEFENSGLKDRWRGHFRIKMTLSGPSGMSYCRGEASLLRAGGLFLKVTPVLEKLFAEGMVLRSYKCLEAWKKEVKGPDWVFPPSKKNLRSDSQRDPGNPDLERMATLDNLP